QGGLQTGVGAEFGAQQPNEEQVLGGLNCQVHAFEPAGPRRWAGGGRWGGEDFATFEVHEEAGDVRTVSRWE
ncbi:MAG: hypothetical protein NT154_30320, partial [Verrucomicrobia bacterium]|nr:hypothetical protein [Verrucomicrobiota bacterium]